MRRPPLHRLLLVLLTLTIVVWLFPGSALAQASVLTGPPSLTGLTPLSVTTALLAAVTAFVVNAVNSGTLFGLTPTPQPWLPYFGVLGPFLAAVTFSLTGAGSLSGVAVLNALLAGFWTLVGSAVGASTHSKLQAHFTLHTVTLAARAAKAAAKKVAAVALLVGIGTVSASHLAACLPQPTAAQQEQAGAQLLACVVANWGQPVQAIAVACTGNEIAVAEDIIADVEAALAGGAIWPNGPAGMPDAGDASAPVVSITAYRSNPHIAAKIQLRLAKRKP